MKILLCGKLGGEYVVEVFVKVIEIASFDGGEGRKMGVVRIGLNVVIYRSTSHCVKWLV